MTPQEVRSSASLASIFALRMLGMFLILPVFAVHARSMPGGDNATLIGLAMGMYGLTQSFGQIPFGAASDRFGRKPVIIAGLLLFALGSFIAAFASTLEWVIVGRAVQGAGAISAAVTAFIADATREEHRTKAMAMVGGSIGITFAVSLIAAPLLYRVIGMGGIFGLTGVLSLLAILVVAYVVPPAPRMVALPKVPFSAVLRDKELMRLNYGVFVLHLSQMAMFVVVPQALVKFAGIPVADHWKIYLPVVLASFILMLPPVFVGEKQGKMKQVFLGAIGLMLAVQAGFFVFLHAPGHWLFLAGLLLAFFVAFNILEASQPSLVSRIAPPAAKGSALGVYNTLQALGLFCGGALGGWLNQHVGGYAVFAVCAAVTLVWLIMAASMRNLPRRGATQPGGARA
ncbi:MFS transporter [Noviherbaspirillum galbum]|uniref:MFS transporter n=1 Tax=Noviherbaspirillum galbum TaxID=2709383 RepID=A0A6B3SKD3_9BURK|nr:MFS transporter [Noviherbaspirillum galbum]NEX61314.1 MFS transporter [Noviherbaspirillum galbum]